MEEKIKPTVLISNDDGISAPGIRHLWNALHEDFDVTIVAPNSQKSGSGCATTLFKPLHIFEEKWEKNTKAYRITGTPTDSIKIALSSILEKKPDLIISGINPGSNAGAGALYSGTVGCTIEGALRNITSIAFSCEDLENPNFIEAEKYIPKIAHFFLNNKPPMGTLINVTFPKKNVQIKGIKLSTQGKSRWLESPDKRNHPEGHHYYWLGGTWSLHEEEKDHSDTILLQQGYITASPIKVIDLTDVDFLNSTKVSFEKILEDFN